MPSGIYKRTKPQWNKGKKMSKEFCENLRTMTGERSNNWKGDNIGRWGVHRWIERHLPKPNKCFICNNKRTLELSNIDHTYKRRLKDYQWKCISCHRKYDYKKGLVIHWRKIR